MAQKKTWVKKVYDVLKKPLDMVDDIYYAILSSLMKSKDLVSEATQKTLDIVGPLLVGSIGIILHAVEFFKAIKNLYKLFYLKKTKHFFKPIINTYNLLLSGTGIGLSVALIAGVLGAPVAALALAAAPMLVPAFLLFIYVNKLINNCVKLNKEMAKASRCPQDKLCEKNSLDVSSLHKRKCKVAFNSMECAATALVVIGAVTGCFPVLIVGVALGFAVKIVEIINEKTDYSLSRSIERFFSRDNSSRDNRQTDFSMEKKSSLTPLVISRRYPAINDLLPAQVTENHLVPSEKKVNSFRGDQQEKCSFSCSFFYKKYKKYKKPLPLPAPSSTSVLGAAH